MTGILQGYSNNLVLIRGSGGGGGGGGGDETAQF